MCLGFRVNAGIMYAWACHEGIAFANPRLEFLHRMQLSLKILPTSVHTWP